MPESCRTSTDFVLRSLEMINCRMKEGDRRKLGALFSRVCYVVGDPIEGIDSFIAKDTQSIELGAYASFLKAHPNCIAVPLVIPSPGDITKWQAMFQRNVRSSLQREFFVTDDEDRDVTQGKARQFLDNWLNTEFNIHKPGSYRGEPIYIPSTRYSQQYPHESKIMRMVDAFHWATDTTNTLRKGLKYPGLKTSFVEPAKRGLSLFAPVPETTATSGVKKASLNDTDSGGSRNGGNSDFRTNRGFLALEM